MAEANHRLTRDERLRSFGALRRLFKEGRSEFIYPFRYMVLSEETAESSPIGEPFISLFFTVINPSEHAASVAPGGEGRGEGEPRTGPGRKGGAPGFVAFRELCCHSNGAF